MGKKDLEREVYSSEEAFESSLEYFKGDDLAARVWVNKYALKDSFDNIYEKNPNDMHRRLAKEIARVEAKYPNPMEEDQVYSLLEGFKYIVPQGGPMTGIGNNHQVASLSNCFVIGNEGNSDSYGGIMKIDQEQVQLMKRRGGVGHDLSHIRPKGSPVKNSALTSTGIVPFMERYSNSTREVAQDGRRGALMLSVDVKHPDSTYFVDAKMEQGKITGANISVKMRDDFMEAVEKGETSYKTQYPVNSDNPQFEKEMNPQEFWNKLVHNAWKSAEPGILFWDTVLKESIPDAYADLGYGTVSTNPCGEIPLCPYDSCRLLAMNLYSYVENPFTDKAEFNFDLFKEHVGYAQRIMDDIIDLELEKIDGIIGKIENDPESEEVKYTELKLWENIKQKAHDGRRTGVGITAEGDMLAALGKTYGTEGGTDFSVEVHKTLTLEAYRSSVEMAKERGAFKIYDAEREKNKPLIKRIREEDEELYQEMVKHGRRNIALLTIAPTGTTSLMTQTTSGIEPVFKPFHKRRRKININDKNAKIDFTDEKGDNWEEYFVFHHRFVDWLESQGHEFNPETKYSSSNAAGYSEDELTELVKKSPYHNSTSEDVDWLEKVRMQGRIQKWVDHSISVTHNLPSDVNEELVGKLYFEAWKNGCKGVTVYRDGSRQGVLLTGKEKKNEGGLEKIFPLKRPVEVDAKIFRFKNQNGHLEDWTAFTGLIGGRPYETFTGKDDPDDFHVPSYVDSGKIVKTLDKNGKRRYDFKFENKHGDEVILPGISHAFNPEFHNYAILFSGMLQQGTPINQVIKTASKLNFSDDSINTWIKGFIRSLKPYAEGQEALGEKCDDCGTKGSLVYQEGCLKCSNCGCSKCG